MEATRPNGKLYRSRKPPVTILFEDGDPRILALRCASYADALRMAVERVKQWDDEAVVEQGHFGWWRETIRNCEPYWDFDTVRGAPGYLFRVS